MKLLKLFVLSFFVLSFFVLFSTISYAKDMSKLYPRSTIEYWHTRYANNIKWNWENVILGGLTVKERKKIGNISLKRPLIGNSEIKGDPLLFTFYCNPPTVIIPILSVKFLDDLSVAYAWLIQNDYKINSIFDYLAMLKYNDPNMFPSNHYPDPHSALKIPKNALKDPLVDDLSQKIFKSSLAWIMANQFGRVINHPPNCADLKNLSLDMLEDYDASADRFATEIMRRIGVVPAGIALFFTAKLYWNPNRIDFTDNSNAYEDYLRKTNTQPVTAERLRFIAGIIIRHTEDFARGQVDYSSGVKFARKFSDQLIQIALMIDDENFFGAIKKMGQNANVISITPIRNLK